MPSAAMEFGSPRLLAKTCSSLNGILVWEQWTLLSVASVYCMSLASLGLVHPRKWPVMCIHSAPNARKDLLRLLGMINQPLQEKPLEV